MTDETMLSNGQLGAAVVLVLSVILGAVSATAVADDAGLGPMIIPAADMHWDTTGNMAKAGMGQINLVGDPTKSGPYTIRLRFPAGYRLAPHSHPDSREVTVLQGEWCSAYGAVGDDSKLTCLTAGGFYTEPKGLPHYLQTRAETIIQVTGFGPSGREFVRDSD